MTISSSFIDVDALHHPSTTAGKIADFKARRAEANTPMGETALNKVRGQGRMTARERLDYLLDEGSFIETDQLARHRTHDFGLYGKRPVTDGIVTGWGTIDGREVCIFSQDGTVFGGALGEVYGEKMIKIMELAVTTGRPLIGLYEGAGARIQDGAVSLDMIARTFYHNINASGVVPQISVIMGACAGGNAYSPALTDFVVMVDQTSKMFVTGPDVIKTVTGEMITQEELGGASAHMAAAGNSHYTASSDEDALEFVQELVGFLPSNNRSMAPREDYDREDGSIDDNLTPDDLRLDHIIPDSPASPYDVRDIIESLTDDGDYLEIQADRAENVVIAFGRIEGESIGFVANQPTQLAGCLDIDASEKAARFIRTCDAFNIPVVMLVDVPGFLPGAGQEHNGILRRGAKLLYAYGEATVPKITVTMRKAYGGAYCVMGSKGLGADVNLAWPTAQIAVMGAAGAVGFLHRKELAKAVENDEDVFALTQAFEQEYENHMLNPYMAAERGLIDAVILPSETRGHISRNLRLLRNKHVQRPARKHGNIPL
ncbi:methylmalonyl-CoA carboxyltransferase [Corynebacterium diphtheriae]|uniref:Methylmalonyl-CoA carboxyltransferase n=1 Tax=Corynebacterium diphtheriae bv. gravis TaxID=1720349 RepID=A0AAX0J3H7_CORDP|nr:acyl-CoA carboxylase subunit beta [Corynebacterium diphtheriae]ERA58111.1 propionyl-CoA carboxylase complex B subunit [Corynebacterium diphtheriae DSM 43988]AEX45882.1 propionyl-CoA carboxylase complex B subunit [Corynebacterium diphtheriae INCA 402]AEX66812.1 propionyl-CoA carboxylase complex B subunit [Corynebacterium diphtheriae C7 (beta)]MBG9269350.1 acyl-CoA carboxylase subunit beta [Corynebacterium diphtheriae bv. gravis]MBG9304868.1 acyl-CoA carboxylase subunit beta [Corynebacterium 